MLKKYTGNYSAILGILTLIEGVVGLEYTKHWDLVAPEVLQVLQKLILTEGCGSAYQYYTVPHPWVQIKALKILAILSTNKDPSFKPMLSQVLNKIINSDHQSVVKNKNNIQGAILFEAIKVIIKYKKQIEMNL